MKNIFTLAMFFVMGALPIMGQTYGASVNVNGDFELASIFAMPNPPASPNEYVAETWYRVGTNTFKETVNHIGGLVSPRLNASSTTDAVIYQRSTGLEANTTYKLTVTARIQNVAGASGTQTSQGFMYVAVRAGTYWAQFPSSLGSGLTFNTATNTTKSFEFNTGSNTDIVVQSAVWKANWGIGYFDDIMIQKKLATITTLSSNETMGSVSASGTVNWGVNTSVTATPNSGYRFINWTESDIEVSTEATYSFDATTDRNLVANFESDITSAAPEIQGAKFTFSKTAASGLFSISNPELIDNYKVFDVKGQLVRQSHDASGQIDLVNSPDGIYVVKVLDIAGNQQTVKLIKN